MQISCYYSFILQSHNLLKKVNNNIYSVYRCNSDFRHFYAIWNSIEFKIDCEYKRLGISKDNPAISIEDFRLNIHCWNVVIFNFN